MDLESLFDFYQVYQESIFVITLTKISCNDSYLYESFISDKIKEMFNDVQDYRKKANVVQFKIKVKELKSIIRQKLYNFVSETNKSGKFKISFEIEDLSKDDIILLSKFTIKDDFEENFLRIKNAFIENYDDVEDKDICSISYKKKGDHGQLLIKISSHLYTKILFKTKCNLVVSNILDIIEIQLKNSLQKNKMILREYFKTCNNCLLYHDVFFKNNYKNMGNCKFICKNCARFFTNKKDLGTHSCSNENLICALCKYHREDFNHSYGSNRCSTYLSMYTEFIKINREHYKKKNAGNFLLKHEEYPPINKTESQASTSSCVVVNKENYYSVKGTIVKDQNHLIVIIKLDDKERAFKIPFNYFEEFSNGSELSIDLASGDIPQSKVYIEEFRLMNFGKSIIMCEFTFDNIKKIFSYNKEQKSISILI